jgi:hypothetical protein
LTEDTKIAVPNYLKMRDDRDVVELVLESAEVADGYFSFRGERPSWASRDSIKLGELRARIEPWLVALFQSEHLAMLAGSGLTTAVHYMAVNRPAAGMGDGVGRDDLAERINRAAAESAKLAGREATPLPDDISRRSNIEDKIRVANELLRGYEILEDMANAGTVRKAIETTLGDLATAVLESERSIVVAEPEARERTLDTLVSFLASFASRTGTRDRLHIFTTNYDRVIELGAELAGIHLLDRFVGSLTPIFRSSRLDLDLHYNPPGIRGEPRYLEGVVRFTKLHGSLDWAQSGDAIRRIGLPVGASRVAPYLEAPDLHGATPHALMIYPNAAKDRETAGFPYVELFRDMAAAVCRPNSCLVTYGYGFGDEHINRVIEDMLTLPSTHLVIISFDDPMGRMRDLAKKRPAQVSLLIGPALADIGTLTKHFLPKAAIDRATSRMSELLKARFGAKSTSEEPEAKQDSENAPPPSAGTGGVE